MKEKQTNLNNQNKKDWRKYNLAKRKEKRLFYELLYELGQLIPEPPRKNGRPPVPVRDLFFSLGLKLYSNYSGRKIDTDLNHAKAIGYISVAPHFNTMHDFLKCLGTYDLLKKLLVISALPLKNLEDDFSMDASGFGAYGSESWRRVKYDKYKKETKWKTFLKGHIFIGTRSNVICSCEVTNSKVGDATMAPNLLQQANGNFNIRQVSADKAYSSRRILQIIQSLDAIPFIAFKENANPNKYSPEIWIKMYNYFKENKEKFMKNYHRRSNVETVFSMIKMRLGEFLKCKNFEAQRNELMMKFICHNICCLITQKFIHNIDINFKVCEASFVNKPLKKFIKKDKRKNNFGNIKFKK
ncbi:MAG: transposase [Candidatus Hodarchaeota archaeon]